VKSKKMTSRLDATLSLIGKFVNVPDLMYKYFRLLGRIVILSAFLNNVRDTIS
jgi:hypothetical protein